MDAIIMVRRRSVLNFDGPDTLGTQFDNRWLFYCFPEEGGASICFLVRYSCLNSALPRVEVGNATIN
jgi:hypothetical protein